MKMDNEQQEEYGVQDLFNDIKTNIYNDVFRVCNEIENTSSLIIQSKEIDMYVLRAMLIFAISAIAVFAVAIPLIAMHVEPDKLYLAFLIPVIIVGEIGIIC